MNKLGEILYNAPVYLDALSDPCLIIDRDFCVIYANDFARDIFKLNAEHEKTDLSMVVNLEPTDFKTIQGVFHTGPYTPPIERELRSKDGLNTYLFKVFSLEAGKAFIIATPNQKPVSGYVAPEHCNLINSLGELVALSKRNGNIFFRNRAFNDFFNIHNPDRVINFFDLLRFDNPISDLERLKSRFTEDENFHVELKARSIKGEQRWLQWHIYKQDAVEGGNDVLQLSGRDIHNTYKMQEALKKSEQRFLDVAFAAGEFIWETDDKLNFTYVSDKVTDIMGYRPQQLIGRPVTMIFPETLISDLSKNGKNNDGPKSVTLKATHKNGNEIWLRASGSPIQTENQLVKGFRGVTLDITAEHHALKSLHKSEQSYELLFQQTPIGVFRYDENLILQDCNESFCEILHATKEDLIGLDMKKLEDKRILPSFFAALNGERGEYEGEYLTTLSQRKIYINLQCVPFNDPEDNVAGGIGLVKDITKTYLAEKALKYQLELEMLALDISTRFINLDVEETDDVINEGLKKIGTYTNADRCYLFTIDQDKQTFTNTHEWVSAGIPPVIDDLQQIPLSAIPYMAARIPHEEYIMIPDVSELGEEGEADKKLLQGQNIKSLVLLPVRFENQVYGFFGFDFCRRKRTWRYNEIIAFKQLGNSFASILNRRSTEMRLRNSEERFRSLVQNATDIITIVDPKGRIQYNSPSFYRITGYSQVFADLRSAIHPDDLNMALEAFSEVVDNPSIIKKLEIRFKKADDSYAYFESLITNQISTHGIDALVINSREVTERKMAEIELRDKQNFITTVSKTIPGILYVYDLIEDAIIYRNTDFDEFLGYSYKPIFHLNHTNNLQIHPDDIEKTLAFQSQIRTDPKAAESIIDFRVKSATGQYRWMLTRINIFARDENGVPTQVLGLVQDITERKEFEEMLSYISKAVEQSSDGVSVSSPDGFDNIYQNRVFSTRLGYKSADEMNLKGGIVNVFKDPELATEITESVKNNKPWSGEVILKPAKGDEFPALLRADAVRNDLDKHIGTVMIWSDISRLKEQEEKIRINEQMLKSINTNVNEGIFRMDKSGKLIYANKAFYEMFGIDIKTDPKSLDLTDFYLNPADFTHQVKQLRDSSSIQNEEVKLLTTSGDTFWGMVSIIMVEDQKGEILIDGVISDVTLRKTSEIAQNVIYRISESAHRISHLEELYEEIFVSLAQLIPIENYYIALLDEEREMLHFPYYFDKEESRCDSRVLTNGLTEYILKGGQAVAISDKEIYELIEKEDIQVFGTKPRSVLGIPLSAQGRTVGVLVMHSYSEEVTYDHKHRNLLNYVGEQIALTIERKRTENLLEQEKTFANSIISSLPSVYYLFDEQFRFLRWNENFEKLTGYNADEIREMNVFDFFDEANTKFIKKAVNIGFQKDYGEVEATVLTKSGEKIPFYFSGTRVVLNNNMCISGVGIDITERRKAEEQIKASLKEKKILLSEVHHRVKNNLAVITGLLSLQAEISDSPVSRQILRESEIRIRSMAMIHEKLYQTDIYSSVEFDSYVKDLSNSIQSMFDENGIVEIVQKMNNLYLSLNKAIPCGLIINELLTNSFKHAFKGREKGKIEIAMSKTDTLYELVYHDDGVGLPDDFDIENTSSLGMKLIDGLSGQLGGSYSFDGETGATFRLKFEDTE